MTDDPFALMLPDMLNPFPATAVASGAEAVTVETPALREARYLLAGYLTAPPKSDSGNVIAIVGDYGTGKTHLAAELLRHIDRTAGDTTHTIDIEASTGNFVLLYQKLVAQLDQMDVIRRVREYYADIVADDLRHSELTADLAPRMRSGELDPVQVVDQLNLMDSDLLQRVRRKLEDVTNKEEFSTALTLLLRTGFDRAVWEWFRGGVPDQILVDRRIKDPIATDADALEAMGVFALLYGHRGHRFVLVIDELDKLLSTSRGTATATVDAFKRMLQVFAAANALLILVGLPDYIDAVGPTVVERIGRIVRVSALTTEHAEEYIRRSQQEAGGTATLTPFTHDTVKYLVEITDGVARRVVRLCHHLYRKAVSEETQVTEAMVREVARAQIGFFVNIESVRREVRRTLDAQGLRYFSYHPIGPDARARVDYWIPLGYRDSGCAVLLTDSVFGPREVRLLNERSILIKNSVAGAETVLIVVGYLPSTLSQELTEVFGIEPLVYDHWTFNESLAAILSTRATLIEDASAEDPLTMIRNRVERMNRQQTNTQRFVEQLATHIEAMRALSDHEFGAIRRDLDGITQALQPSATVPQIPDRGAVPPSLPPSVSTLFDDASSALSALSRADGVFRQALTDAGRSLSDAVEARMTIRTRLAPKVFEAMGVASLLRTLLNAFQDAVTDWHRTHAGAVRDLDKVELGALCRSYDALYDFLPLFRLKELDQFELSPGGASESFYQTVRSTHLTNAYQAFDGFGNRVQTALLSAVSGAEH